MLNNVYDFDHTIYRGDASLDFIIFCLGRHPALLRFLPSQAAALFLYAIGKWDRKQIKQVAFAFLGSLKNIDEDVEAFWVKHERKVEAWYMGRRKPSDIIISASPEFLLAPVATKLGVKNLIGTKMNAKTGKITGKNCRAEEKVARLEQYDNKITIANCYSDSMSDLPLLKLATNAFIVKKGRITKLEQEIIMTEKPKASKKQLLRELVLYGIIGGSTAALDVILFQVFLNLHIQLFIANFVSVNIAIALSFLLNAKFNFKKTDSLGKRAIKFFSVGYFGLLISFAILWLGVDLLHLREVYVKIFSVAIVAAVQYVLNKFLTFKN
jgi:HAD superfamily phosphoserine phosphatase-like hydrolase